VFFPSLALLVIVLSRSAKPLSSTAVELTLTFADETSYELLLLNRESYAALKISLVKHGAMCVLLDRFEKKTTRCDSM